MNLIEITNIFNKLANEDQIISKETFTSFIKDLQKVKKFIDGNFNLKREFKMKIEKLKIKINLILFIMMK